MITLELTEKQITELYQIVPSKVADDPAKRKAQQEFHDHKLQPLLEEAKQGKRTVLFVDAAHFVMGAFLGML